MVPNAILLALADDIAALARTNAELQRIMDIVSAFLADNRMKLSIDPAEASVVQIRLHSQREP
jgi:hypothetical protein